MDTPISDFFDTDTIAQTISYTPPGGSATSISAIFDNEFSQNDFGIRYENATPIIFTKTSDTSTATNGATVVISSVTYYVVGVEPDGTGITKLILSKNSQ